MADTKIGKATLCPGSRQVIREDHTDGNGITTCPGCSRYRATRPAENGGLRKIEPHVRVASNRWLYVDLGDGRYGVNVGGVRIGEVHRVGTSSWTAVPTFEALQIASSGHPDRYAAATYVHAEWEATR